MMRAKHRLPALGHSGGIGLIEVLVSLIILAVGLMGVAALQMNSLRNNVTAYERTIAIMQANDIIDRMHANIGMGASYAIGWTAMPAIAAAAPDCRQASCTPAELAEFELAQWKCSLGNFDANPACQDNAPDFGLNLQGALPAGDGEIVVDPDTLIVTVSVRWQENRNQNVPDPVPDPSLDPRFTTLAITSQLGTW